MRFTTEALIIREMSVGESDRLVTMLTREYGVIKAFAPGAKSIKSRKAAATSLLSYSSVTILNKNGTYRISEATPIRIFFKTGSDVVRLSLAQYFCELSLVLAPPDKDDEFLRVILNSLHFLTEKDKNPTLIKAVTELRIAAISGYMPDLIACENCGKFEDNIMYFNLSQGHILCKDCTDGVGFVKIDRTLLSAIRHIVYSKLESIYSFTIPEDAANKLSDLTSRYILTQTEHHFNTLDFYNSIK